MTGNTQEKDDAFLSLYFFFHLCAREEIYQRKDAKPERRKKN